MLLLVLLLLLPFRVISHAMMFVFVVANLVDCVMLLLMPHGLSAYGGDSARDADSAGHHDRPVAVDGVGSGGAVARSERFFLRSCERVPLVARVQPNIPIEQSDLLDLRDIAGVRVVHGVHVLRGAAGERDVAVRAAAEDLQGYDELRRGRRADRGDAADVSGGSDRVVLRVVLRSLHDAVPHVGAGRLRRVYIGAGELHNVPYEVLSHGAQLHQSDRHPGGCGGHRVVRAGGDIAADTSSYSKREFIHLVRGDDSVYGVLDMRYGALLLVRAASPVFFSAGAAVLFEGIRRKW